MSVPGYQNNGETGIVFKTSHWNETATNFMMTPFSIVLIAAAVLSTQVMHTISLPKKYRCVSSLKPEPDPEMQESEPKATSPSCIPKLQLNILSKSPSTYQNSTSSNKILLQPSVSNSSSSATKLQPVTQSSSTVSKLHDTLKLFKLPLQFISTLLTILMPLDGQNTSSTISPLLNVQMPLSLSTIHPYDLLPDSTNNSPHSCGSLSDNKNNVQYTSYDPVPASTNNSPSPCNSQPGTKKNLGIPCSSLPDNKNNLPIIFSNNLPTENSYNALVYSLLCNILLDEIRRLTLNTPSVNMPESAALGDTLPSSIFIGETSFGGNTPTDTTNDLLTSTSNEPILPCLSKPTVKVSKPRPIKLKSSPIKSHPPPTFSAPATLNLYPQSKFYPSNYESFDNLKNFKSDSVPINPQVEDLIIKILRSLNPTFNTSPSFQSK